MHFLFDECMPPRLAKGLQILDADNVTGDAPVNTFMHVTDFVHSKAPDTHVVKIAKQENAIVISMDDDYKNVAATYLLVRKLKVGYVYFKPPKKNGCNYNEIVAAFVAAWPEVKNMVEGRKPPYMLIISRDGKVSEHKQFHKKN